ncbi:MAG: protein kinase [Mycobacterium sp.]|uniref:serine/threonine-protein kinase n=1 Tax=Mycobacterium sp. TaxID=1785 RepID=UPI001EC51F65|nr:serine/threonine-protein kinase [Mycobacterium sp.]MBW0017843.1 protein kinase [Mycobacterium sp.]
MKGTPFGQYRLIEMLGRGGMGEVWRAYDTATDRVVALKLLPLHFAQDDVFKRRFRREAHAAARLSEPHVVPIHTYGEIEGRLFVDMRLINGCDLHTLVASGPLEPGRAALIIEQAAKALQGVHNAGLVHRDVKPSNILVTDDDFAYLIDFGIARAAGRAGSTTTGAIIGTLQYMAPERFGGGPVEARSDVYSLACVLYECLTGSCPYPGDSVEEQLVGHLSTPPPRPSSVRRSVPVAFDDVIATGMAKNPDERYASALDLARAARNVAAALPGAEGDGGIPHPPVRDNASPRAPRTAQELRPEEFGRASADVVSRSAELKAVTRFLISAGARVSGLVISGEAGIGKTTLWQAGLDEAVDHGSRVLSARAGETESVLAYAALADLIGDVELDVFDRLPPLQRLALDRVMLRADGEGPATDQRVVAAAFLAVIEHLAMETPVVLAIDDAQWLDTSSREALAFAVRRMTGPVGVLLAERTEPDTDVATSWLELRRSDAVERIHLGPMGLDGVRALITTKLGRTLARSKLLRIAEISDGNPFYVLELARTMRDEPTRGEPSLPRTLTDLVRRRIGRLDGDVRDMLLAAACLADPTVEQLARATGSSVGRAAELLEDVESNGIVAINGNRVQFSHPLLARGVYTEAAPARRRRIHRALADVVTQPELKARHLALAAVSADPEILQALDDAASAARARGAPAAAAELVDLAISLGGDKPSRRMRSAGHHWEAGNTEQARETLESVMDRLRPGALRAIALNLLAGIRIYDNRYVEAVDLLKRALEDAQDAPAMRVRTLLISTYAEFHIGEFDESLRHAREAVALAEELGVAALTSQALTNWVHASFQHGPGLDEDALRRALELEDRDIDVPVTFRASVVNALILAGVGRLDEGHAEMEAVRQRFLERGAERDLMAVAGYCALIEIWQGKFDRAAQNAEDAVERAEQLGGQGILIIPLTIRAMVNAYAGRVAEARTDAAAVIEAAQRTNAPRMAEWPAKTLGFIEVSLGNYAAALTSLAPLLSTFDTNPETEVWYAWYVPDAVEAMVALGRLDDAMPLIDWLERNGRRRNRSWLLAVGARCRSMWLAAKGDIDAAERMAHQAMSEHEALPMPFERARTQVVLGRMQHRRGREHEATATLSAALRAFEQMGTPLWAHRVRTEIARTDGLT